MHKVLIAEDDAVARQVVRKIIEDMGHIVFTSPDGKHAYDALMCNEDFDLLITDIKMPEMNGEDLVLALRGDAKYADLPIIMMSAVVGYKEIHHLLEIGVSFFVSKPIKRAQLMGYVDQCLASRASAQLD